MRSNRKCSLWCIHAYNCIYRKRNSCIYSLYCVLYLEPSAFFLHIKVEYNKYSIKIMSIEKFQNKKPVTKPSRAEAEAAVEVLLRWAGDDPERAGLLETPARYTRAFEEFFSGYNHDPADELKKIFEDIEGYDDMVLVKDIEFVSHCEHHIAPIIGKAHVAYWPNKKIVGISKLARIVDIYAKRLTSQENMTRDIAEIITNTLDAKGAAVMIDANHQCMSTRGVHKSGSSTVTSHFTGCFKAKADIRQRFMEMSK